ncbi:unnamed protein product [Symbiodinium natans]|uniref:Uncharacterized protein n=1 Tax=Symbiodinium natans TaxID=878477 RepID=A0A812IY13_9DINO|nr:unnamed protein product [Symbiodinium natans]
MVLRYRAEDDNEITPPKPRNLPPLQTEDGGSESCRSDRVGLESHESEESEKKLQGEQCVPKDSGEQEFLPLDLHSLKRPQPPAAPRPENARPKKAEVKVQDVKATRRQSSETDKDGWKLEAL